LTRGSCRYTDAEVAKLPFIGRGHPHYPQWVPRQASWRRLVHYLSDQKSAASILEVGCGNGWLSHQLAAVPGSRVVGLDPNFMELQQAARVFRRQPNLKFIYGDFYSDVLQGLSFDIIVFAAVIHHFPSLSQVLEEALPYLRPRGEIHILDSRLYPPDLAAFNHRCLFHPGSFWNRVIRRKEIFPWVRVMDKTT
jgi:ubiquinone/menaquinone biosynthesis C-methylase UbiE